jgi:hypothetical protein
MENQVFRDPAVKDCDCFRVVFADRIGPVEFNSRGAAQIYLAALVEGRRKPAAR